MSRLKKRFGYRTVFEDISFELATGSSLAITGPNGAGKSTLVKSLLYLCRATGGEVTYYEDDEVLESSSLRTRIGFVAPYLNVYDQLTGEENLKFFSTMTGTSVTGRQVDRLLELVGLEGRGTDPVADYSSGMKQRLRVALALINSPGILVMDEPGTNLDETGRKLLTEIVIDRRESTLFVIATNDGEEAALAQSELRLGH